MELERWAELSAALAAVAGVYKRRGKDHYPTALIVRVYLWAALFDRPISWACHSRNWKPATRPEVLPDQSTMSRRRTNLPSAVGAARRTTPLGAEPLWTAASSASFNSASNRLACSK